MAGIDRLSRFRRHKKVAAAAMAESALPDAPLPGGSDAPAPTALTTTPSTARRPATAHASLGHRTPDAGSGSDSASTHSMAPPFASLHRAARRASPQGSTSSVDAAGRSTRASRSPFRDLLRSSTKRSREARESPPAPGGGGVAAVGIPPGAPPSSAPESPTTTISARIQNMLPVQRRSPVSVESPATKASAPVDESKPRLPAFLDLSPMDIDLRFCEILRQERTRLQIANVAPAGRWARVSGTHLRLLDRYANIQPWDRNRVRLHVPPGRVDYINASPIVLTTTAAAAGTAARPPDRYIAMQGPKQASADHVWRMVYEQLRSPAVIVMLTETHEGPLEKCYPYFPQHPDDPPMLINRRDEFGDGFRASVRCVALESLLDDAIEMRRIVLRVHRKAGPPKTVAAAGTTAGTTATTAPSAGTAVAETESAPLDADSAGSDLGSELNSLIDSLASSTSSLPVADPDEADMDVDSEPGGAPLDNINYEDYEDERIVYHFLYKKWPDFGVPDLADVDSFFALMRLSAEKNADADNPRIVHCSAGVGRSGTFIALEHLMRELDAGVLEHFGDGEAAGGPAGSAGQTGQTRQNGQCTETDAAPAGPARTGESLLPGVAHADDLIFTTVNQLREQRRTMVQADAQYHFIYEVLRKLWLEKHGVVEADESGAPEILSDAAAEAQETQEMPDSEPAEKGDEVLSERAPKRLEVDPFVV